MKPENGEQFCFHGGAFFDAVGVEFDNLERSLEVINADVLDAWFPPSPRVLDQLREFLPWIVRTSPPTNCEGLVSAISRFRNIPTQSVLPGAGSSSLIFLALREWLKPSSRVLILDPSYGEYEHVCGRVIGCRVDHFQLTPEDEFLVNLDKLSRALAVGYDLVVLVNPNNPTGRHIPRRELERFILDAPTATRFWIDEAYVDYVDSAESLEQFASEKENVIVCKSMSKAYALSGLRIGYLCSHPGTTGKLRGLTPPWAVSLPGQIAGVGALQDPGYYQARYLETGYLRQALTDSLKALGITRLVHGKANFLFFDLPDSSIDRTSVLESCMKRGLFLRDPSVNSSNVGPRAVRIAVKDAVTNQRMTDILQSALHRSCG